jgi:hypothetical protein
MVVGAMDAAYKIGAGITWFLIFIGAWIYCIVSYGFLLGVGLGWLAAGITATVLCWFWPLYVAGGAILGFVMFGGK